MASFSFCSGRCAAVIVVDLTALDHPSFASACQNAGPVLVPDLELLLDLNLDPELDLDAYRHTAEKAFAAEGN